MAEEFIPLAVPNIGELEAAAVNEALATGFISSVGPAVEAFERNFAELVGSRYAVACSSGTAALHVALQLVGVEAGKEVYCSDFTFIGSGNPISYLNASPVFVDSEMTTWNLDPELIADDLKARAKQRERLPAAIEVVHILGQPAQMEAILNIADHYGIPVIEDAAESLGSTWTEGRHSGKHTGSVGRIGCFSFNGNKIATTGGGGMIVTDDSVLAERARHLTTQAKVPDVGYLHDEVGYNYRLTNLAAALGNAQLIRLPSFVHRKREIASRYDESFSGLPLTLPPNVAGYESNRWLYSILLEDEAERNALLSHLAKARIGARALWRPLSQQPAFVGSVALGAARNGRALFERGVSLPCSTDLSEADQSRVIDAVLAFYATR